jgi:hypothetical protein
MEASDLAALKEQIITRFSDIAYPGDDNITVHRGRHLEKEEIARHFRGRRWQEISLEGLQSDYPGDASACLAFMTVEAFRYYLPAYLLILIDDFGHADVVYDSTIRKLTRSGDPAEKQLFHERFDAFSDQQKSTIAQFLERMSFHHGGQRAVDFAKVAVDSYWRNFL